MITASNISLSYGKRTLFKDVNIKFTPGNCYGVIGANGAGKSTFLKIMSGAINPDKGDIILDKNKRLAFLEQDQHKYDAFPVIQTVMMGHKKLYEIMKKRDEIYAKEDFSDADGVRAAELESEFAEMNGYEAESDAGSLLNGLGIPDKLHNKKMVEMESGEKVRILLAQALFGNPDILLLDEPTNNLDIQSITWLENFLINFENTVVVVSHDRHFLNQVCTHIADIDFSQITVFVGNYEFWRTASELVVRQRQDANKKKEDKQKELQDFIARFSSNASKAKQATSRKKMLEKITLDDIAISSRKYPFIHFKPERECGKMILTVTNLNKTIDGEVVLKDFNLNVNTGDKIAFVAENDLIKTVLFEILAGNMEPDSGTIEWGQTITKSYFPRENKQFFETDLNLVDWLRQYSTDQEETFVRGFLGRMLFSGEESQKKANILSGGEKVRCMLSRMMLTEANTLMLDEPTNHLDLEAITSLNNALIDYKEVILFSSQDHQFVHTIANRIIELSPNGYIDKMMPFDDYLTDPKIKALREKLYEGIGA
jgi:ATPase subunit of ABC transporter with duplicated ATPase domains